MSAPGAGGGQRRGGGEGKVSRQPGAAPPPPPAPGAPRGSCRAGPPAAAPRNAPERPGLAPAPARHAGAGALQRRAPRSRRSPRAEPGRAEPSPATLCGRNRGCWLSSSGERTAKGLCGGKRQEGEGGRKPPKPTSNINPPEAKPSTTHALASRRQERKRGDKSCGLQALPPLPQPAAPRAPISHAGPCAGAGRARGALPQPLCPQSGAGAGPRSARSGAPRAGAGAAPVNSR